MKFFCIFFLSLCVLCSVGSLDDKTSSSEATPTGPWEISGQGWNLTLYSKPEYEFEIQEEGKPYLPIFGTMTTLLEAEKHSTGGWEAIEGTQVDINSNWTWKSRGAPQNITIGGVATLRFVLDGTPKAGHLPVVEIEIRCFPDSTPIHQDSLAVRFILRVKEYKWHSDKSTALVIIHRFTADGRQVTIPLTGNSIVFGEAEFYASATAHVESQTTNSSISVSMWQFHTNYWQVNERFADGASLTAENMIYALDPHQKSSANSKQNPSGSHTNPGNPLLKWIAISLSIFLILGTFLGAVIWYYTKNHQSNKYSVSL